MSEQAVYDIKLPPEVAAMLHWMVTTSEKEQVLIWECLKDFSKDMNIVDYQISAKGKIYETFKQGPDDILYALQALGLINWSRDAIYHKIFLTKLAYEWARYDRKKELGRFIYRYWPGWKYIIQGVFGALITIIPALWVFLELLYYWGLLQKKP